MEQLLIVDDEQELLETLSIFFRMKGFQVITAATGPEAVLRLETHEPDVIILDLLLKGPYDGNEVLRRLRHSGKKSRVVMLTGSDDPAKEKEARAIGLERFIHKPVTIRELYAIVQNEISTQSAE